MFENCGSIKLSVTSADYMPRNITARTVTEVFCSNFLNICLASYEKLVNVSMGILTSIALCSNKRVKM